MIKNIINLVKKIFKPIEIRGINRSQFNWGYYQDKATQYQNNQIIEKSMKEKGTPREKEMLKILANWQGTTNKGMTALCTELVEYGRKTVLEDFDIVARCDGFVGFTSEEWAGIQRFFKLNKELSKWDK